MLRITWRYGEIVLTDKQAQESSGLGAVFNGSEGVIFIPPGAALPIKLGDSLTIEVVRESDGPVD